MTRRVPTRVNLEDWCNQMDALAEKSTIHDIKISPKVSRLCIMRDLSSLMSTQTQQERPVKDVS